VARDFDLLGGASLGGWLRWRKKHEHLAPVGSPCANCQTPLQGPYCYNCGQLAETFERSVWRLFVELFESFFHFDGRLFQTLPKLALRPGKLTRDYLDGKRAFQIPPLRMFLIVILVLFFAGGLNMHATGKQAVNFNTVTPAAKQKADVARAKALQDLKSTGVNVKSLQAIPGSGDNNINIGIDDGKTPASVNKWIRDHLKLIAQNRHEFTMLLEERAHWVAIGLLPIAALILGVLFVFQRRFYLFDHLIFTMHSLSFQGLLFSTVFLLEAFNVGALTSVASMLPFLSPVHLFVHMRGTYKTSIFGTLLRMALLWLFSLVGFTLLFTALIWTSVTALEH
jgi:hypothetical protein